MKNNASNELAATIGFNTLQQTLRLRGDRQVIHSRFLGMVEMPFRPTRPIMTAFRHYAIKQSESHLIPTHFEQSGPVSGFSVRFFAIDSLVTHCILPRLRLAESAVTTRPKLAIT